MKSFIRPPQDTARKLVPLLIFIVAVIALTIGPPGNPAISQMMTDDATLSGITIDGSTVPSFDASQDSAEYGVASDTTQVKVAATTTHADATYVVRSPADSDANIPGHQVRLSSGKNRLTFVVTAADDSTTKTYRLNVNRGVTDLHGWAAQHDLDTLKKAGNLDPDGIYRSSDTIYVLDWTDQKVYAYNTDGTRNSDKDIDSLTKAGNVNPVGLWGDGTTLWVSDLGLNKIYAYDLNTGNHDADKDINTLYVDGNDQPWGIWSNGITMWVADLGDKKLYAYSMSDKQRDSSKDFNTPSAAGNAYPRGIWSDGVTMWVVDSAEDKVFAYKMNDKSHDPDKDINNLIPQPNNQPAGIWGDGTTLWIVDSDQDHRKVFAYNMVAPPNIFDITVDGTSIPGFHVDDLSPQHGVAPGTARVTVAATTVHSSVTVEITAPDDADENVSGHQVDLSDGTNAVAIQFTNPGDSVRTYNLSINRGVDTVYGWAAQHDLDTLKNAGNRDPHGIYRSSNRVYVVDNTIGEAYAYNTDGTRSTTRDLDKLDGAGNDSPTAAWSDGSTIWIADQTDTILYAYTLSSGSRESGRNITISAGSGGVWGNTTTIWAAIDGADSDRLEARDISDGRKLPGKDIVLDSQNANPQGIWSNGKTIWVADGADAKLYAYDLGTRNRQSDRDFNTLSAAGNSNPRGLSGRGLILWVTDADDDKAYAYNLPPEPDLADITVDSVSVPAFYTDNLSPQYGVVPGTAQVTVAPSPAASPTTAQITAPADADLVTPGHQVNLEEGANAVTIRATASEDSARTYNLSINRGVDTPKGWAAHLDLDTLRKAGNKQPRGISRVGNTIYVADATSKIYAYRPNGTRHASGDFNTLTGAGNETPTTIWSDGTTMWVVDHTDNKLYAYTVSTKQHDLHEEFKNLIIAGNTEPTGIWSDGATMWVADQEDGKIYAYRMSNKLRDSQKDFNTLSEAGNESPTAIWSDHVTMWVADSDDNKLYAYNVRTKKRDPDQDFDTLSAPGNELPGDMWGNGSTLWITDGDTAKAFAYNMTPNPDLIDLTVDGSNVPAFYAKNLSPQAGVTPDTTLVTIAARPVDPSATVEITSPADADTGTPSHQVDLSHGANVISIAVTARDGVTIQTYNLSVNRGTTDAYGWAAQHDLDTLRKAGNQKPRGIYRNANTAYVVNRDDGLLFAYRADGTNSLRAMADPDNDDPHGLWGNGTTLWVADTAAAKLYAYRLTDGGRDSGQDFDSLVADNASPNGIWSDDATIWIADADDKKLYAYNMSTGARDQAKDFDTLTTAGNEAPTGIWSNGTTMWVADDVDAKLYAYNLGTKAWDPDKDFDTLAAAGNLNPAGIWGDGLTMWVTDEDTGKVHAYNILANADLMNITVDGVAIPSFYREGSYFEHGVSPDKKSVTVAALPVDTPATVEITSPTDADTQRPGHQIDLSHGANAVAVTVTGTTTRKYQLNINRGVTTPLGWAAQHDLDTLKKSSNLDPDGIYRSSDTIYVLDWTDQKVYAYNTDGTRNSDKDIDSLTKAGNVNPVGLWGDGTTLWVSDLGLNKIYAYDLNTGNHDADKDINTLYVDGNDQPWGIWSNGITMWVADLGDKKLYAYSMSDKQRDSSKDFNTPSAAGNAYPRGIWSDGVTMWVVDSAEDKVFAYKMNDKSHDPDKDINNLIPQPNNQPAGIWGDGATMWIADQYRDKVYSYNMPLSADNSLSDLTVSPKDITGFDPERTSYEVGVASTVPQATVVARATNGAATVNYSGADADDLTPGHQVNLSAGRNEVTVTVTAQDDTTQDYTVSVNRGVSDDYGWKADDDLDALVFEGPSASIDMPVGIVENNGIFWVSSTFSPTILAYQQDGARLSSRDITPPIQNNLPLYLWTDGQILWNVDSEDDRLYAYQLSDGSRQTSREFDLHADHDQPRGIWSDGATMWVADDDGDSLYAYRLSDGNRQESREFDLDSSNNDPQGIWSDGYTVWVADSADDKMYAYDLQGGERQAGRDFNTLSGAGNTAVADITSDGRTMWGVDFGGRKVFSYNMPTSANANLSSLTVGPKDIIGFDPGRTSYEIGVASTVAQATITAAADHPAATVGFSSTDADLMTDDHQVTLLAGRNSVTVTVTAEDDSTRAYTITINRGVKAQYGWNADEDLDGLIAADNRGPRGIWGNSTTFYISDFDGDKVYAYNRDGTRDGTKDFDTTGSTFPNGIWSDGTTLWVADSASTTLFAYTLSNGNRNTGAEITLANSARGVWGNSTTVWAVNDTTNKLEAYQRSDGTDDDNRDITLHADNGDPAGIWSDDTTIWVADHGEDRLFAYTLSGGARDMTKEIDTSGSGNENPRGLWGEGETIWVTDNDDDRVYSYNLQERRSSDNTLSALITSPRNILRFVAERTAYEVGVASTVTRATVTATANDTNASVDYSGTDADDMTDGHQVDLSAGRNEVTVTVTAEDESTKRYRVRINRGVDTPYGWNAEHDIDALVINFDAVIPAGITAHDEILWVSSSLGDSILAYRADGQRLPSRDIRPHTSNSIQVSLWNDGETLWAADSDEDKLFAYWLSDGRRRNSKEFDLHTNNTNPNGIWSDGATMWVADAIDSKVYAYALDGGARQESREFDLASIAGGLWSDGLNIWVADEIDDRLFAYDLATGNPQSGRNFTTLSGAQNQHAADIWSDGSIMWVVDYDDDKVYSYNMPLSNDTSLSTLTVSPKDIIGFDAGRTSYQVGVASAVAQATITATANHEAATVDYSGTDADLNTTGHQVNLSAGRNAVTVTVTAEDGTTREYRVSINRGVTDTYGWNAGQDLDGLIAAENQNPAGVWGNDTTLWISDLTEDKLYAYNVDGTRNANQDFDTLVGAGNNNPQGLWSNGATMWILDGVSENIFAYSMSDKQRDSTREFNTLTTANNNRPRGIWSNGATMWVSDETDRKLYAYNMTDKQRDESKDFNNLIGIPAGIWSNDATMWVRNSGDDKLFAYDMETKTHVGTQDFNTLSGAGNNSPRGIWSDRVTMWVVDSSDDKVYSYNMGLPPPANIQPNIGDRRIAITWDDPQESAITGYQYRVSSDDAVSWNPDWTTMPGSNARTTTFTVRGLTNNVEHVIEVRALEGAKQSEAARFTATPMGPPSVPRTPENLDTVAGDQTLYLSWYKPTEDPRAPVTSFDAKYRSYGSSRSWRNAASVSVEQTAGILYDQTIEGLDNRRTYEVQVAAVNSVGRSEWATASAVPQAEYRYGPPSADGEEDLNLGPLHASWTDRLNSVAFHPDQKRLNINVIENSCMAPATFRIFWDIQGKAAKEYEADIQTRGGAGEFTHQFGTETLEGRTQTYIYGTAPLHKSSTLSVRVRALFDPEGWSTWSPSADLFCFVTDTPATSLQLAEGDNSPATGRPAIAGAARVGETLSATTSGIADPDGLTSATFSYQWNRGDGSTNTGITDATAATYTLQEEDLDYQVSVTVAFTDDEGNDETLTSAPVHVQPQAPLSGAFDSATLPSEHDGSNTFTFELYFSEEPNLGYEAVRDHVLDVAGGDVTKVRRTTQGSNLRWEITVQPNGNDAVALLLPITANCGDDGAVCTSSEKKLLIGAAVFVRGPAASQEQTAANTPATGNPAITGTARVGETLSADTSGIADADGLQNATFSHQWVSSDGATDTDIPGETGAAYVVLSGDVGQDDQGTGELHRRHRQRRDPDQRGHGRRGGNRPQNAALPGSRDRGHRGTGRHLAAAPVPRRLRGDGIPGPVEAGHRQLGNGGGRLLRDHD